MSTKKSRTSLFNLQSLKRMVALITGSLFLVSVNPALANGAHGSVPPPTLPHHALPTHTPLPVVPVVPTLPQQVHTFFSAPPTVPTGAYQMDLGATTANIVLGTNLFNGASSVSVNVGGTRQSFQAGASVTPAEYLAIQEVLQSGRQTLLLNSGGAAIGGQFSVNQATAQATGNLVVPQGVTGIQILNANNTAQIGGALTNFGKLYDVSTKSSVTSGVFLADSITNEAGAVISTRLPASVLSQFNGALPHVDLSLGALNGITNYGTISSSGSLLLATLNGSINNAGGATIAAHSDVNLMGGAVLNNNGTIDSLTGNINISTVLPTDITINASGGTFQALAGNINITSDDNANITLNGGNYSSQQLNLYAGTGDIEGAFDTATGTVNSLAGIEHFGVVNGTLYLGNNSVGGDPTYYSINGDVDITGLVTAANATTSTTDPSVAILAGGNIIATSASAQIDTSALTNGTTNGGTVYLIAGATLTPSGDTPAGGGNTTGSQLTTGTIDVVTSGGILTANATSGGGDIDLHTAAPASGAVINTAGAAGGNVYLVAVAGTTGGHINVPSIDTHSTGTGATATGGSVTVVAGANDATAVKLGSILTAGGAGTDNTNATAGTGGAVSIITAAPQTKTAADMTFNADGTNSGDAIQDSAASYASINSSSLVSLTGNINTSGMGGLGGSTSGTAGTSGGNAGTINIAAGSLSSTGSLLAFGGGGGGGGSAAGQTSGNTGGDGGNGAAINVSANSLISISGQVNASGGGGGGASGACCSPGTVAAGGAGGAAGAIGLSAPNGPVSVTGAVAAAAGGAGGASSNGNSIGYEGGGGGGASFGGGGGGGAGGKVTGASGGGGAGYYGGGGAGGYYYFSGASGGGGGGALSGGAAGVDPDYGDNGAPGGSNSGGNAGGGNFFAAGSGGTFVNGIPQPGTASAGNQFYPANNGNGISGGNTVVVAAGNGALSTGAVAGGTINISTTNASAGAITTGSMVGNSVTVSTVPGSAGAITTGGISATSVSLTADTTDTTNTAKITVNGSINTAGLGGAGGVPQGGNGSAGTAGGAVTLQAGGDVSVTGDILAYGGGGGGASSGGNGSGAAAYSGGAGGSGGNILVTSANNGISISGQVNSSGGGGGGGSVPANNGPSGGGAGGSGGAAGTITLQANVATSVAGGVFAVNGGNGGNGGGQAYTSAGGGGASFGGGGGGGAGTEQSNYGGGAGGGAGYYGGGGGGGYWQSGGSAGGAGGGRLGGGAAGVDSYGYPGQPGGLGFGGASGDLYGVGAGGTIVGGVPQGGYADQYAAPAVNGNGASVYGGGAIVLSGGAGGVSTSSLWGGSVQVSTANASKGAISVGSIVAPTSVALTADPWDNTAVATVTVAGSITTAGLGGTGGGSSGSAGGDGTAAGSVTLQAGGDVSVTGSLLAYGGGGGGGSSSSSGPGYAGGKGGNGGTISVSSSFGQISITGSLNSSGGGGGGGGGPADCCTAEPVGAGGAGGIGGAITLSASNGPVSVGGSILAADGGAGGNSGFNGSTGCCNNLGGGGGGASFGGGGGGGTGGYYYDIGGGGGAGYYGGGGAAGYGSSISAGSGGGFLGGGAGGASNYGNNGQAGGATYGGNAGATSYGTAGLGGNNGTNTNMFGTAGSVSGCCYSAGSNGNGIPGYAGTPGSSNQNADISITGTTMTVPASSAIVGRNIGFELSGMLTNNGTVAASSATAFDLSQSGFGVTGSGTFTGGLTLTSPNTIDLNNFANGLSIFSSRFSFGAGNNLTIVSGGDIYSSAGGSKALNVGSTTGAAGSIGMVAGALYNWNVSTPGNVQITGFNAGGSITLDGSGGTTDFSLSAGSSAGNGGAIVLAAPGAISLSTSIDTSSTKAGSAGGNVIIESGASSSTLSVGAITTGGAPGGSVTVAAAAPGTGSFSNGMPTGFTPGSAAPGSQILIGGSINTSGMGGVGGSAKGSAGTNGSSAGSVTLLADSNINVNGNILAFGGGGGGGSSPTPTCCSAAANSGFAGGNGGSGGAISVSSSTGVIAILGELNSSGGGGGGGAGANGFGGMSGATGGAGGSGGAGNSISILAPTGTLSIGGPVLAADGGSGGAGGNESSGSIGGGGGGGGASFGGGGGGGVGGNIPGSGGGGAGYYGGGGAAGFNGGGTSTAGNGGGFAGGGAGGTSTVTFINTQGQAGGAGFGGNSPQNDTPGVGGNNTLGFTTNIHQYGTGGGWSPCCGAIFGANGGDIPTGSGTGGNITLTGSTVSINGTIATAAATLGTAPSSTDWSNQSIFGRNLTFNAPGILYPGTATATTSTTINLPAGTSGGIIDSTSAIDLSTLTSLSFSGQNLAIVSSSNITSSSPVSINLSSATGDGGSLTLIAGFTAPGNNTTPTAGTFTIGAAGTGSINIPNVTIDTHSTASNASGGNVVAISSTGPISLGAIDASDTASGGTGGSVLLIGPSVSVSGINASGGTNSGTLLISSSTPQAAPSVQIVNGALVGGYSAKSGTVTGSITIGGAVQAQNVILQAPSIVNNGSVSTGQSGTLAVDDSNGGLAFSGAGTWATNGGLVSISAKNNVNLGGLFNGSGTFEPASSGANLVVMAGNQILASGTASTSGNIDLNTASGAGGSLTMVAGANYNLNILNPGAMKLTGRSGSAGGIDLTNDGLSSININALNTSSSGGNGGAVALINLGTGGTVRLPWASTISTNGANANSTSGNVYVASTGSSITLGNIDTSNNSGGTAGSVTTIGSGITVNNVNATGTSAAGNILMSSSTPSFTAPLYFTAGILQGSLGSAFQLVNNTIANSITIGGGMAGNNIVLQAPSIVNFDYITVGTGALLAVDNSNGNLSFPSGGSWNVTGGSVSLTASGTIDLGGLFNGSGNFMPASAGTNLLVAAGNGIKAGFTSASYGLISTNTPSGAAGSVTMLSGVDYQFNPLSPSTVTVTGPSGNAGGIDLSNDGASSINVSINTSSASGSGGAVTLVSFGSNGNVLLDPFGSINTTGTTSGGNILVLAGATPALMTTTVQLGALYAGATAGGAITLAAQQPAFTGGNPVVYAGSAPTSGSFTTTGSAITNGGVAVGGNIDNSGTADLNITAGSVAVVGYIHAHNISVTETNGGFVNNFGITATGTITFDPTSFVNNAPMSAAGDIDISGLTNQGPTTPPAVANFTNTSTIESTGGNINISSAGGNNVVITDGGASPTGSMTSDTGNINITSNGNNTEIIFAGNQTLSTPSGATTLSAIGTGCCVWIQSTATVTTGPLNVDSSCLILDGTLNASSVTINSPTPGATIANTTGDVNLPTDLIFNGQTLAILSSGNINGTGITTIDLSSTSGNGGTLTMVAGFNFTPPTNGGAGGQEGPDNAWYVMGSPSAGGGSINLAGVNITTGSTVAGGLGGDVIAAAHGGSITLGNIDTTAANGTSGNVALFAGAGVNVGNISTAGSTASGNITLASGTVKANNAYAFGDGLIGNPNSFSITNPSGSLLYGTLNNGGNADLTFIAGQLAFTGNPVNARNLTVETSGGFSNNVTISALGTITVDSAFVNNTAPWNATLGISVSGLTNQGSTTAPAVTNFFNSSTITNSVSGDITITSAPGQNVVIGGGGTIENDANNITITALDNATNNGTGEIIFSSNQTFSSTVGPNPTLNATGPNQCVWIQPGAVLNSNHVTQINSNCFVLDGSIPNGFNIATNNAGGAVVDSTGDINLPADISTPGNNLVILASGNINGTGITTIDLSGGGATVGGSLTMIAGYNFFSTSGPTPVGQQGPPPIAGTFELSTPSGTGGSINLPGVNILTSSSFGDAGNVTAVAREGRIVLGNIDTTSTIAGGGTVTLYGNGITVGNITTAGTNTNGSFASGSVMIASGLVQATGHSILGNGLVAQASDFSMVSTSGAVSTGNIDTSGAGGAANSTLSPAPSGANAGSVTIAAGSGVTTGYLRAYGGGGAGGVDSNGVGGNGGNGGNISLSTLSGNIAVGGDINASGGGGGAGSWQDGSGGNGGKAGSVTVSTPGSLQITGPVLAAGGGGGSAGDDNDDGGGGGGSFGGGGGGGADYGAGGGGGFQGGGGGGTSTSSPGGGGGGGGYFGAGAGGVGDVPTPGDPTSAGSAGTNGAGGSGGDLGAAVVGGNFGQGGMGGGTPKLFPGGSVGQAGNSIGSSGIAGTGGAGGAVSLSGSSVTISNSIGSAGAAGVSGYNYAGFTSSPYKADSINVSGNGGSINVVTNSFNVAGNMNGGGVTISNTSGDLNLVSNVTAHGENVAILSTGNITGAGATAIDVSSTTGNGGSLSMLAGFNLSAPDANGTVNVLTSSTGSINLPGVMIDTSSSAAVGDAGSVAINSRGSVNVGSVFAGSSNGNGGFVGIEGNGITVGSSGSAVTTTGGNAFGSVSLLSGDIVRVGNVSYTGGVVGGGGGLIVQTAGGNIFLNGDVQSGTGVFGGTFTAVTGGSGSITEASGATLNAGYVNLTAGTGGIGTATQAFQMNGFSLSLNSTSNIYIADSAFTWNATATGDTVELTGTDPGVFVDLGAVNANNLVLTTTGGSEVFVSGNDASFSGGGVPNSVSITTANLTLTGVTLAGQSVTITGTAGNDLSVNNPGTISTTSGNLEINTAPDTNLFVYGGGSMSTTSGTINLTATLTSATDTAATNIEFSGNQNFSGTTNLNATGVNQCVVVDQGVVVTGNSTININSTCLDLNGSPAGTITAPNVNFNSGTAAGTIANPTGDVNLTGGYIFHGLDLTILAAGNVNAAAPLTIDLSSPSGNGGNFTVIAGYNFTPNSGGQVGPSSTVYTLGAPSSSGGSINLPAVDVTTASTGGNGGNVVLLAHDGFSNIGSISIGNINTTSSTGAAGNVTIFGQGGISTGDINTTGNTVGLVNLAAGTPTITGTVQVWNGTINPSFTGLSAPSYSATLSALSGNINVGSITAAGTTVNILTEGSGAITQTAGKVITADTVLALSGSGGIGTSGTPVTVNAANLTLNGQDGISGKTGNVSVVDTAPGVNLLNGTLPGFVTAATSNLQNIGAQFSVTVQNAGNGFISLMNPVTGTTSVTFNASGSGAISQGFAGVSIVSPAVVLTTNGGDIASLALDSTSPGGTVTVTANAGTTGTVNLGTLGDAVITGVNSGNFWTLASSAGSITIDKAATLFGNSAVTLFGDTGIQQLGTATTITTLQLQVATGGGDIGSSSQNLMVNTQVLSSDTSGAGNVFITDSSTALALVGNNNVNNYTLNAPAAAITQSAGNSILASGTLTITGASLNNAGDLNKGPFGNSSGNVLIDVGTGTVTNTGTIFAGAPLRPSTLTINAGNFIGDTGSFTAAYGAVTIDVGSTGDITVENTGAGSPGSIESPSPVSLTAGTLHVLAGDISSFNGLLTINAGTSGGDTMASTSVTVAAGASINGTGIAIATQTLSNSGTVDGSGADVTINGGTTGGGANIVATTTVTNDGSIFGDNVAVAGANVTNNGTLSAGNGDLTVNGGTNGANTLLSTSFTAGIGSTTSASNNINITAASIDNFGSLGATNGTVILNAGSTGTVTNESGASMSSGGDFTITADQVTNNASLSSGGDLTSNAGSLTTLSTSFTTGAGSSTTAANNINIAAATIDNAGSLTATTGTVTLNGGSSGSVTNESGASMSSGGDFTITGDSVTQDGSLTSGGALTINAGTSGGNTTASTSVTLGTGTTQAAGDINIASVTFGNSGTLDSTGGNLTINGGTSGTSTLSSNDVHFYSTSNTQANAITIASGTLEVDNVLQSNVGAIGVTASGNVNVSSTGQVLGTTDVTISAVDLDNSGEVNAGGVLNVTATAVNNQTSTALLSASNDVNITATSVDNTGSIASSGGAVNMNDGIVGGLVVPMTSFTNEASGIVTSNDMSIAAQTFNNMSGGNISADGNLQITGLNSNLSGTSGLLGTGLLQASNSVTVAVNGSLDIAPLLKQTATQLSGINLVILANGDINNSNVGSIATLPAAIDTSSTFGDGGSVTIVSGAAFNVTGLHSVVLTGGSTTGGSINFTTQALSINTSSTAGNGGDVNLIALRGSGPATAGTVSFVPNVVPNQGTNSTSITTSGTTGSGNVTIAASGVNSGLAKLSNFTPVAGSAITVGDIVTTGGTNDAMVTVGNTNQPINLVTLPISFSNGTPSTGFNPNLLPANLLNGSVVVGKVTTDDAVTGNGYVTVSTNGTLALGQITTHIYNLEATNGTLFLAQSTITSTPNSFGLSGNIALTGGSILLPTGNTSPLNLIASGANGGGQVFFEKNSTTLLVVGSNVAGDLNIDVSSSAGSAGRVTVKNGGDLFVAMKTLGVTQAGLNLKTAGNGADVTLKAGTMGPGKLTVAGNLDVSSTSGAGGSLDLESNSPTIFNVTNLASTNLNGVQGALKVFGSTSNGDVTIINNGGSVSYTVAKGDTTDLTKAANVTFEANGKAATITVGAKIGDGTGTITLDNTATSGVGGVNVKAAVSGTEIDISSLTSGTATAGNIALTAPLNAAGGIVTLTASGKGTITESGTNKITADTLTITAGTGAVGSTAGLLVNAINVGVTGGGAVAVNDTNTGLATILGTTTGSTFMFKSAGNIDVGGDVFAPKAVTIASTAKNGSIILDGHVASNLPAGRSLGGTVTITATGAGTIADNVGDHTVQAGIVNLNSLSGDIGSATFPVYVSTATLNTTTTGSVYIVNQSGTAVPTLTLAKANSTGTFDLTSDGNIVAKAALPKVQHATFDVTGNGNLTLTSAIGSHTATFSTQSINANINGTGSITGAGKLTANVIALDVNDGNIGTAKAAVNIATVGTSATLDLESATGLVNVKDTGTVATTLSSTSKAGSNFTLATSGSTNISGLATTNGSISVIEAGGTLAVDTAPNNSVVANNGTILLENSNTSTGKITITDSLIETESTSATGGRIAISIGAVPKTPVIGPAPLNCIVNPVGLGSQVYFGTKGIIVNIPSSPNTIADRFDAINTSLIFNAGSKATNITVNNSQITADPPAATTTLLMPSVAQPVSTGSILQNTQPTAAPAATIRTDSITTAPAGVSPNTLAIPNGITTAMTQLAGQTMAARSIESLWISETELSNGEIPAVLQSGGAVTIKSTVTTIVDMHTANGNDAKAVSLNKGSVVFAPKADTTVHTAYGDIKIGANSVVLVIAFSGGVGIYDLDDSRSNAVSTNIGNRTIAMHPGTSVVVTDSRARTFDDINPAQLILYRNVSEQQLGSSMKAFVGEFMPLSAIHAVQPLRKLVNSKQPEAQRIGEHLLKTAAIVTQTRSARGQYKQVLRPSVAAWAQ